MGAFSGSLRRDEVSCCVSKNRKDGKGDLSGDQASCCETRNNMKSENNFKRPDFRQASANSRNGMIVPSFLNLQLIQQEPEPLASSPVSSETSPRNIPSWERAPEPLPGWTVKEQNVLISELGKRPQARRNADLLELVVRQTHRQLPEKSVEDIYACFRHLEVMRIAYFGTGKKARFFKSPQTPRKVRSES